jgi:hypothetical protein
MPLPDSLPWMESVDAKVARAEEHLATFDAESLEFFKQSRPTFIRKTNGEAHWLVCYTEDPFPPLRLSVLAGEVLFNLRSALDNLICGLIKMQDSKAECDKSEFPIFSDEAKYAEKKSRLLRGIPATAIAIVEQFQPWQRPQATREVDPLWIIHTLCNHDKHRALNLAVCAHRGLSIIIPMKNGVGIQVTPERVVFAVNPVTVKLPGKSSDFEDNASVHVTGRTVLFLVGQAPLADLPVSDILNNCVRHVAERIVPQFRPFFRKTQ